MNKKVILHIDDLGSSVSANISGFELLNMGIASSGSLMVPCNGFKDAIIEFNKNRELDLGIHLTLTSEWDSGFNKWKPTLSTDRVPSLIDQDGFFHQTLDSFFKYATYEDIKKEVFNQIKIALNTGLIFSHYDSHMWALLHKKFFKIHEEICKEFCIQPFIVLPTNKDNLGNRFYNCEDEIKRILKIGYKVLDNYDANSIYTGYEFNKSFINRLIQIKEGTTFFLLHTLPKNIYDSDIIPDYKARQKEHNILKSKLFKKIINQLNIESISMKDFIRNN